MTNLEKVIERATEVLGSEEKALEWIEHMSGTLGDKPAVLVETDEDTDRVLFHLADIARHSVTDL